MSRAGLSYVLANLGAQFAWWWMCARCVFSCEIVRARMRAVASCQHGERMFTGRHARVACGAVSRLACGAAYCYSPSGRVSVRVASSGPARVRRAVPTGRSLFYFSVLAGPRYDLRVLCWCCRVRCAKVEPRF